MSKTVMISKVVSAGASAWCLVASFGVSSASATGAAGQAPAPTALPEALEVRLAESAAPANIRSGAGLYLYKNGVGLVRFRVSKNGFNCFVARTNIQARTFEYRDDLLIPICYDAVGSKYILPTWLLAEELRAKGLPADKLLAAVKRKVVVPPKPGISPMLSPILRTGNPGPPILNYPHYMFYAPGMKNDEILGEEHSHVHHWVDNDYMFDARNAYLMHAVGVAERASINREFKDLIRDLCAIRKEFCLDTKSVDSGLRAELQKALKQVDEMESR